MLIYKFVCDACGATAEDGPAEIRDADGIACGIPGWSTVVKVCGDETVDSSYFCPNHLVGALPDDSPPPQAPDLVTLVDEARENPEFWMTRDRLLQVFGIAMNSCDNDLYDKLSDEWEALNSGEIPVILEKLE